jgi:hypothetical protein
VKKRLFYTDFPDRRLILIKLLPTGKDISFRNHAGRNIPILKIQLGANQKTVKSHDHGVDKTGCSVKETSLNYP